MPGGGRAPHGTLFSAVLPTAFSGTTYNANNELTKLITGSGTIQPAWDKNGNLTSDGTSTYIWDARNRLLSVGSLGSFRYDAAGRRLSLAPAGGSAQYYLYDRLNPVAVLNASGTALGQFLTGLNLDERFSATASGVTESYLVDALGSTVALANAAGGNLSTTYAYSAFGATQQSGASNPNPFQFTGRENDPTGLYYLRARYYNPNWGRFISEDPIGLNGGSNVYVYAGNNPLNLIDPWGLSSTVSDNTVQALFDTSSIDGADVLGYANLTADDAQWSFLQATNVSWGLFGINSAQSAEFSSWANASYSDSANNTLPPVTVTYVRYDENQSALIDLVQRYRRGLTMDQGQILMD